ncbi:MAG TPA: 4'-phosphopantetheinyl transferase superfamily protein [Dokdonella sp.]
MSNDDAGSFERRAAPPPLGEREVHAWFVAAAPAPRGEATRRARAALARLLRAYAGTAATPALARSEHGKPFAPDWPDLHFNVSHAGAGALLAFARGQALGVDLEALTRRIDAEAIATRFFAPAEAEALARVPAERRSEAFLRLWTCKEAVVKAVGRGLSFGLDRVEFRVDARGRVEAMRHIAADAGPAAEWMLHALAPAPGLVGAIAWRGAPRVLRRFELAAEPGCDDDAVTAVL